MSSIRAIALLALTTGLATVKAQDVSGSGKTTRYWDCCKGSCAWDGKADVSSPVKTCDIDDNPITDTNAQSGCNGGDAYMCSDQSPWAVNSTMAYGFGAVHIPGGSESSWCCACYELTFTSTSIEGKKMIIQATNTGADLAQGQFDIAMPGGGVGIYNGCTDEWGAPSSGWGAQYGGISSNTCNEFPSALQPGCDWRFDWFEGADNPTVDYKQVTCPKAITDKTGCVRAGETPTDDGESSSSPVASSSDAASSSAAPASSSQAASSAPASSSAAAAPSSSSAAAASSAPAYEAPSSSAAASSSAPAYEAPSSAAAASSSAPAYEAPSSSEAAPVSSSAAESQYASSSYPTSANYGSASSSAAAPSDYASGDEACEIQYVYEYE